MKLSPRGCYLKSYFRSQTLCKRYIVMLKSPSVYSQISGDSDRINISKKNKSLYAIDEEIGEGSFSLVYKGYHQLTNETVAIKTFKKKLLTVPAREMLLREIAIMDSIYHPNIIRLYEVLETPTKFHIVMEYMCGGDLQSRMLSQGKINEIAAKLIFAQLVSALRYLHDRNIVHRDIKCENVLCGERNNIKLGDFGFSTILRKGNATDLYTLCGSLPYAAPELLQGKNYKGQPVDIWALGILLFYITAGYMPFPATSMNELMKNIQQGLLNIPKHVSHHCHSLIKGILKLVPCKRFTMIEIRNCEWLSDTMITENIYDRWCSYPTKSLTKCNEIELEARQQLLLYGINNVQLDMTNENNISINTIATYRITIQKILNSINVPTVTRLTRSHMHVLKKRSKSSLCYIL